MKKTIFAIAAALLLTAGIIGASVVVSPVQSAQADCSNSGC